MTIFQKSRVFPRHDLVSSQFPTIHMQVDVFWKFLNLDIFLSNFNDFSHKEWLAQNRQQEKEITVCQRLLRAKRVMAVALVMAMAMVVMEMETEMEMETVKERFLAGGL